jgi:hypothetical protein
VTVRRDGNNFVVHRIFAFRQAMTCCGSIGCCAATEVLAVTGQEASGATKVRAATDFSSRGVFATEKRNALYSARNRTTLMLRANI